MKELLDFARVIVQADGGAGRLLAVGGFLVLAALAALGFAYAGRMAVGATRAFTEHRERKERARMAPTLDIAGHPSKPRMTPDGDGEIRRELAQLRADVTRLAGELAALAAAVDRAETIGKERREALADKLEDISKGIAEVRGLAFRAFDRGAHRG